MINKLYVLYYIQHIWSFFSLETLRREKVELENTLEQEQEALVNKLWKRMDQLETEKR